MTHFHQNAAAEYAPMHHYLRESDRHHPPSFGDGSAPAAEDNGCDMGGYERRLYCDYYAGSTPQHQHHHYHHYAVGGSPAGTAPACVVCEVQQVDAFGAACSRRCGWVAHGCCPQCGRVRSPSGVFCSQGCAVEARQANWCVGCGVRQLQHGTQTCGAPHCQALFQRVAAYALHARHGGQPSAAASRSAGANGRVGAGGKVDSQSTQRGGRHGRMEPHGLVALTDKVAAGVKQHVGPEATKRLAGIVRVGGAVDERKAYTAYRCRVEAEMNEANGIGAPKYGHGGEGNEQRRFVPLRTECGLEAMAGGGDAVRTCGSETCEACVLLDRGIRATCHAAAIPAFSSVVEAAARAAGPGPGCVAVAVCRVTLGTANVVASTDICSTSQTVPGPGPREHSTVVKHANYDVAYVATNHPTVDPQFVLFLRL